MTRTPNDLVFTESRGDNNCITSVKGTTEWCSESDGVQYLNSSGGGVTFVGITGEHDGTTCGTLHHLVEGAREPETLHDADCVMAGAGTPDAFMYNLAPDRDADDYVSYSETVGRVHLGDTMMDLPMVSANSGVSCGGRLTFVSSDDNWGDQTLLINGDGTLHKLLPTSNKESGADITRLQCTTNGRWIVKSSVTTDDGITMEYLALEGEAEPIPDAWNAIDMHPRLPDDEPVAS